MGSVDKIQGNYAPIRGKIIFIFINLYMKLNASFNYESIINS